MSRKWLKVLCAVLLLFLLVCLLVYWAFFDLQRIKGQELTGQVDSPDGNYTVMTYRNNGGATTGYAVLCRVRNNQTGREKNIYWQYHCESAHVQWEEEPYVVINGRRLNVEQDVYDFRRND